MHTALCIVLKPTFTSKIMFYINLYLSMVVILRSFKMPYRTMNRTWITSITLEETWYRKEGVRRGSVN